MWIKHHISLKPYHTFGVEILAKSLCKINTVEELLALLPSLQKQPYLLIGGGSNILITRDINRLVVLIQMKGIEILKENKEYVWVKAMAGENWHQLVQWTLNKNFGGLENLSLIPGNVGTAPIQNIGAYGVELKDYFYSCEVIEIKSGKKYTFTAQDCAFGYRNSIFKTKAKNKYIILSVTFKLNKQNHQLHTSYGEIRKELAQLKIDKPNIKEIARAVINIRKRKLPDPKILGNGGSFFKNPIVTPSFFKNFTTLYPQAPFYKINENKIKIPAAWMIEQCGFKGKRIGDVGVYDKQSLVLVNYGKGTGKEIMDLAKSIQKSVFKKFQIAIETEVNIIR